MNLNYVEMAVQQTLEEHLASAGWDGIAGMAREGPSERWIGTNVEAELGLCCELIRVIAAHEGREDWKNSLRRGIKDYKEDEGGEWANGQYDDADFECLHYQLAQKIAVTVRGVTGTANNSPVVPGIVNRLDLREMPGESERIAVMIKKLKQSEPTPWTEYTDESRRDCGSEWRETKFTGMFIDPEEGCMESLHHSYFNEKAAAPDYTLEDCIDEAILEMSQDISSIVYALGVTSSDSDEMKKLNRMLKDRLAGRSDKTKLCDWLFGRIRVVAENGVGRGFEAGKAGDECAGETEWYRKAWELGRAARDSK